MAVAAAETQNNNLVSTFDARPPELEIYGRSLSTPYRLGVFMVAAAANEVDSDVCHSPEADQARAEFYTSVEEGFGTDLELGGGLEVRDFGSHAIVTGRVMAKDLKTPVSDMTSAGLICATDKLRAESARGDWRFYPQLTRSKWDHQNALITDKMVRGETNYNTRIAVTPFPEEAAEDSGDDYWRDIGYVPHLRRGFVQLYHARTGELVTGSLSFDGSNKERLREIFSRRGIKIPDTEITDNWLQYAITGTFSEDEAKAIALELADEAGDPQYDKTTNTVEVTSEHRTIMDTAFDESYIHACESLVRGYQTPGARQLIFQLAHNAVYFNDRYAKALYGMRADENKFTDDDMTVIHELLVYSTIEMMRALHLDNIKPTSQELSLNSVRLQSLSPKSFQNMLGSFAAEGAKNNRTYSACGLSISAGESAEEDENPQTVFGRYGARGGELAWAGGRVHYGTCVNCSKSKEIGVKNWCKDCIKGHCGKKKAK